jgi:hypothetical protein
VEPTSHQLDSQHGRSVYGLVAEFDTPEDVLAAARLAREAGYRRMDAFSPFPVEGLSEALGHRDKLIPYIMLAGGIAGGVGGFAFLTWTTVIDYPLNIGGRPLFAWPSFIPITFELTVLLSALSGILGMFVLNGLPEPYHPLFEAKNFDRASSDRFFLAVEARDPRYDSTETRAFLENLNPLAVQELVVEK